MSSAPGPSSNPDAAARADFDLAKQYRSTAVWDAFLQKYPTGFYAEMAREERAKLQTDAAPAEAAASKATAAPAPPPPSRPDGGTVIRHSPPLITVPGSACGLFDRPQDQKNDLTFTATFIASEYGKPNWPSFLTARRRQLIKQLVEFSLGRSVSEEEAVDRFVQANRIRYSEYSYKGQPYEQIEWLTTPVGSDGLIFAWGTNDVVAFEKAGDKPFEEKITCNPNRRGDVYIAPVNLAPCNNRFLDHISDYLQRSAVQVSVSDGKPKLRVVLPVGAHKLKGDSGRYDPVVFPHAPNNPDLNFPSIAGRTVDPGDAWLENEYSLNDRNEVALSKSTLNLRFDIGPMYIGYHGNEDPSPPYRLLLDGQLISRPRFSESVDFKNKCASACRTLTVEIDAHDPKPGTYGFTADVSQLRENLDHGREVLSQMLFKRNSDTCQ